MFEPISVDDTFSVGAVMSMFVVDAILYFIIAWYLEGVWPGEFGVPKPWYFPFSSDYWCPKPKTASDESYSLGAKASDADASMFEPVQGDMRAGLDLRNLRKEWGKMVAVKGTTLQMYVP